MSIWKGSTRILSKIPCAFSAPYSQKMAKYKFIDIGANLTDEMYSGIYNGKSKHEADLNFVLKRAWEVGVQKIFITAGNLEEGKKAAQLSNAHDNLYSTIGVHPTRCNEFQDNPEEYINNLKQVCDENKKKIVALGEFGLDYERTQFCSIDVQNRFFELQLKELGPYTNLPLFLHCRGTEASSHLRKIMTENRTCFPKSGVVHSFDGSLEEMKGFLELGLYIGINGCSLKSEENCKVVEEIPVERILLETDAPWCAIRPSHFSSKFVKTIFPIAKKNWNEKSMFKARNEPQTILNVLEVIAGIKEMDPQELSNIIYENTLKLFF